MTIVAGYYSPQGPWPDRAVHERADLFLGDCASEAAASPVCEVKRWDLGHVVAIRGRSGPCQAGFVADQHGNFMVTHGYLLRKTACGPDGGLASAVQTDGAFLERDCEGEFVVLMYASRRRVLHIVNDRFAARAFYLHRSDDTVFFSSSLPLLRRLLARPLKPCPLGWAQMLCHIHTVAPATTFQDTERLTPAAHVRLGGGESHSTYWRLRPEPKALSAEGHADTVFEVFRQSVRQRAALYPRAYVPLSGGLDSRLIAACIPEGQDVPLFTFNPSISNRETPELAAAREVASALGRQHNVVQTVPPSHISARCCEVVQGTGGQKGIHHVAGGGWPPDELVRDRIRFSGGPGDVLAGSYPKSIDYIYEASTAQCVEHFMKEYVRGSAVGTLRQVMRTPAADDLSGQIEHRLRDTISGMEGPTAAHKVTAWSMVYRQPSFTLLSGMHQSLCRGDCCPHLGYDYVALMLQLPADWIFQRNFYKFMIYRCIPGLRNVMYANTGSVLPPAMTDYRSHRLPQASRFSVRSMLSKPKSLLARGARRLRAAPPQPVPEKPYLLQVLQRDQDLHGRIRRWSTSSPSARELLDPDKTVSFVDRVAQDRIAPQGYGPAMECFGALATLCVADEMLGAGS